MKRYGRWLLLAMVIGLTACGGSEEHQPYEPPVNYVPELRNFDVLDSYDVDTRLDRHTPLALNPYQYDGLFDVFWRVNSLEDYRVELRINDRPTPHGSFLIHSEWCGAGLWCDQGGSLICEYTTHFSFACEGEPLVDVRPLFPTLPLRLYLVMQVCDIDSSYCEFKHYPVWME